MVEQISDNIADNTEESLTFEQALSRLGTVIEAMEDESITLESSIALYKEGVILSDRCTEILDRFEAEITILQREDD